MKNFQKLLLVLLISTPIFAKQESWYWGFGLGPDFVSNSIYGVSAPETGIANDLVFYFPLAKSPTTVIGPSMFGGANAKSSGNDRTHSTLAFSILHSFGTEPGDGLLIRGDVGLGFARYGAFTDAQAGFGGQAGVGYGFTVSDETRLTLEGRYGFVKTTDITVHSFSILFGPLF